MADPVTRLNAALEGRYHIESELGEGGMATVYLAEDIKHNRNVALKVLKPELAAVVVEEWNTFTGETGSPLDRPVGAAPSALTSPESEPAYTYRDCCSPE